MSDDQSVKNILEDIKKAISGSSVTGSSNLDNTEDILYLKEEYLQNKNGFLNGKQYEDLHEKAQEEKVKEKKVEHDIREQSNKEIFNNRLNKHMETLNNESNYESHLILKENIEEIKMLLGDIQGKLRQPSKPSLTVEELVISLLRPQLSEWLNEHLYELVKEVVQKELKSIINDR